MGFSKQEYWSGVPLPSPAHSPSNLAFPHAPRRVIPELTAGRPAEQDNQQQNEETNIGLGATHFSLCHLDPNFAGVRGCQARTRDLFRLAHCCCLASAPAWTSWPAPPPTHLAPGFLAETVRKPALAHSLTSPASLCTRLPTCLRGAPTCNGDRRPPSSCS